MQFSIVVPVYNVEAYLEQCVSSVLSQSYTDFELILVDDGSPDSCSMICDGYAAQDSRVKVVHKTNGGSSDARNVGMDIASGDYLTFLDSDDWWTDDCLLQVSAKLVSFNYPDILVGRALIFRPEGKNILEEDPVYQNMPAKMDCPQSYFEFLTDSFNCVPWRYFIKRTMLEGGRLRFEKGLTREDELWTPLLLAMAKTFAFNEIPYYIYRINRPGSLSMVGTVNDVGSLVKISGALRTESKKSCYTAVRRKFLRTRAFKAMLNGYVQLACMDSSLQTQEMQETFDLIKSNKHRLLCRVTLKSVLLYLMLSVLGVHVSTRILGYYYRTFIQRD